MNLNAAFKSAEATIKVGGKLIVKHLPTILTAISTVGAIASVVMTAKKAPDAHAEMQTVKDEWNSMPAEEKAKHDKVEYIWKLVKIGARYYGVVCLVVAGEIICMWSANTINLKRIAASVAGMKVMSDYAKDLENQIKENGGDKALTEAKDKIGAEKIQTNPFPEGFDASKLNHMIGETPTWEPISRGWYISTVHKILRAQELVRSDLAKQLRDGSVYAFVPMRDFLEYAQMDPAGPYSSEDSINYLGFAVDVSSCVNHLAEDEIEDLVEQACSIDFTSDIKDGMVGALKIKYREPPKYKFDWDG